jgi:hypothetical protein
MPRRSRPRRSPSAREQPAPKFDVQRNDPLASLGLWGVDVLVADHVFSIPPRPARDWIEAILTDDLSVLFAPDDQWVLDDLVADGEDDVLRSAFRAALVEISGRPWYVAARLVGLLIEDQVRGEVAMRIDIASAPFAVVLDVIYTILVRNLEPKKRAEFERNLAAEISAVSSDPRTAVQRMREMSQQRAQAIGKPSAAIPPRTPRWPPTPRPDDRSDEPTKQQ